jgi:hypothetical protein
VTPPTCAVPRQQHHSLGSLADRQKPSLTTSHGPRAECDAMRARYFRAASPATPSPASRHPHRQTRPHTHTHTHARYKFGIYFVADLLRAGRAMSCQGGESWSRRGAWPCDVWSHFPVRRRFSNAAWRKQREACQSMFSLGYVVFACEQHKGTATDFVWRA